MSLGTFPNVSLQDASIKRAECRELLVKGIDPQDHREQQQQAQQTELLNTYEAVAWTWFKYRKSKRNFSEGYQKDVESLIRRNLLPHFVALANFTDYRSYGIESLSAVSRRGEIREVKEDDSKA